MKPRKDPEGLSARKSGSSSLGVSGAGGGSLMTAIRKWAAVNASVIACSGRVQKVIWALWPPYVHSSVRLGRFSPRCSLWLAAMSSYPCNGLAAGLAAARRAGGQAAITRSRRIPPRTSLRCLPSLIQAGSRSTRLMLPGIEPRSLNWADT